MAEAGLSASHRLRLSEGSHRPPSCLPVMVPRVPAAAWGEEPMFAVLC